MSCLVPYHYNEISKYLDTLGQVSAYLKKIDIFNIISKILLSYLDGVIIFNCSMADAFFFDLC